MNTQAVALYQQAVRIAEQADIAKVKRLAVDYKALYHQASELEKDAALLLTPEDTIPLKKITLLRSAAALAYKAGNYLESEKLVALARAHQPDNYEAAKLDELEAALLALAPEGAATRVLIVTGTCSAANADENKITIRSLDDRIQYSFIVPTKIFKKTVKSYWLEVVQAVGKASANGVLTLEKISTLS